MKDYFLHFLFHSCLNICLSSLSRVYVNYNIKELYFCEKSKENEGNVKSKISFQYRYKQFTVVQLQTI